MAGEQLLAMNLIVEHASQKFLKKCIFKTKILKVILKIHTFIMKSSASDQNQNVSLK